MIDYGIRLYTPHAAVRMNRIIVIERMYSFTIKLATIYTDIRHEFGHVVIYYD